MVEAKRTEVFIGFTLLGDAYPETAGVVCYSSVGVAEGCAGRYTVGKLAAGILAAPRYWIGSVGLAPDSDVPPRAVR